MQVGQFPAAAANSLIQGYCDDFVSLAAVLAQTLEQISMRGLNFEGSRPALQRIEHGMRNLAEAIRDLLERGKLHGDLSGSLNSAAPAGPSNASAPSAPNGTAVAHAAHTAAPRHAASRATSAPAAPAQRSPAHAAVAAPAPAARASAPQHAHAATAHTAHPHAASAGSARPGAARPASEGLRGTNLSMPLLSVFQFLGRMRKAGTMRVGLAKENLTFELENGCIVATTTSQCPRQELLVELLAESGACSADDLDAIVVRVGTGSNERFCQAAVEAGIATEQQIAQVIALQASRRYARACKSHDSKYEFVEGVHGGAGTRFRAQPVPIA